ncbi:hypothetical protein DH2020_036411 [Rehmannia glutinosa]|uniref:Retrotransposon Copia-like N-terminal domain-containing protein n=1 Tax=Rehmannia glutinosa TaxID=99300 RepID=A0ABR0V5Y0_REHGL
MDDSDGSTTQNEACLVFAPTQLIFLQNQLISIKFDEDNFLIWKLQVLTTIQGYGLQHFILEDVVIPDEFLTSENLTRQINPEYITWQRQGQLLASWILSSLSQSMLILMVGLTTAKDIWQTIETHFASQYQAKLLQYNLKLQTLRKENLSMRDYLGKMKGCFDLLASAGERLSEKDQVLHILAGLGSEYNVVMVSATSRLEPLSVVEIQSLLISYVTRFESIVVPMVNSDGSLHSVNNVAQPPQRRGFFPNQSIGRERIQFANQSNRGGRTNRGSFRGRGGRYGNRLICQLCGIAGHTADRCWHRYDSNVGGNNTNNATQSFKDIIETPL